MSIETFFLEGDAGRIECQLKGTRPTPSAAALVLHPHPLFGGTMHNKTVHAAATALVEAGLPTLRFNFRGAGLSEGLHDHGRGEQADCAVVLEHLASRYPGLPLVVAGYSFGAFVGLRVGSADPRVASLIGIGLPIALYDFTFLRGCGMPVALIQGDHDRFGELPALMVLAATLGGAARVLPVPGAAHDFAGRLDMLKTRVREALPEGLRS